MLDYKYNKPYFLLFLALSMNTCTLQEGSREDQYSNSKVKKVNGVYIFIMSEPATPYEKIGDVKFGLYDKILGLNKKTLSQVSMDIITSLSFDKNLTNSIDEVRFKFPDADAVVFNDDMSNCSVIKFKK